MTSQDDAIMQSVRDNFFWYFALGILMIFGGVFAIYAPFEASLVVTAIVGAFFLAGGVLGLVQAITMDARWKGRVIHLAVSGLNVLAGIFLLFDPIEGLIALTLVLLINMIVGGVFRLMLGWQLRPEKGWVWIVIGGVISIAAAIYLFTEFPDISAVLIGLFAGISLIGEGMAYIMLAFGLRRVGKELTGA